MIKDSDLKAICLWEHAKGISKQIPELKGFAASYFSKLPAPTQKLLRRYDAINKQVLDDIQRDFAPKQEERKP